MPPADGSLFAATASRASNHRSTLPMRVLRSHKSPGQAGKKKTKGAHRGRDIAQTAMTRPPQGRVAHSREDGEPVNGGVNLNPHGSTRCHACGIGGHHARVCPAPRDVQAAYQAVWTFRQTQGLKVYQEGIRRMRAD
jgi:hypothetical protein